MAVMLRLGNSAAGFAPFLAGFLPSLPATSAEIAIEQGSADLLGPHHASMDLCRESLHSFGQCLRQLGQLRVHTHQLHQLSGLLLGDTLTFQTGEQERFAMLSISVGVGLVAIGLPRLCQQDHGGGISRLKAEREVQEDERLHIKMENPECVQKDPHCDGQGLSHEDNRRAE